MEAFKKAKLEAYAKFNPNRRDESLTFHKFSRLMATIEHLTRMAYGQVISIAARKALVAGPNILEHSTALPNEGAFSASSAGSSNAAKAPPPELTRSRAK